MESTTSGRTVTRTMVRKPRKRADWARRDVRLRSAVDAPEHDAPEQPADDPETTEPDSAEPSPPRRRPWFTVLLMVLLAAALVFAVLGGERWYGQRQLDKAHQEALAAAKQATVNFVSISASTVDSDLQRIQSGATGEFRDEFSRGSPQVRTAVVENKVESQGTVLRAGLVSGDLDSAVVLVAVDATVKNVRAPDGRPSHYRIQVNLAKDAKSGRWLVAKLQFVG